MKKLFLLMMLCCTMIAGAQETKDVVKFLNIPVDGNKAEMIEKLKDKGFKYDSESGYLSGVFNDQKVKLSVVALNNKVHRIMVIDEAGTDEAQIKSRFNLLCNQFANNDKYLGNTDTQKISEDENIGYEMGVCKKDYQAVFYQKPDEDQLKNELSTLLYSKYTQAQLDSMRKEVEEITSKVYFDRLSKKPVWFTITTNSSGHYLIAMYYDNEYNKSNGSDL